jgi:Phage tail protein (Tail_P2_I)
MPYLLPPNSTPFEKAVSEVSERVDDIETPLRQLWRPDIIREDILPFLAWAYSVDVWYDTWPLEKKRWVTDRSIWLHRNKGTETGIAAHIDLVGGKLLRAIVPPAKTFLMPALTNAEREAFLALFAQLRIYPYVSRGTYRFAHFTSKAFGRSKSFLAGANDPGVGYVKDVGAWSRWVRTAKLWDRGVETNLTIRAVKAGEFVGRFDAVDYDEVILPAKPSAAIFPDGDFNAERKTGKAFLQDGIYVGERFVRVSREADYDFRLGRETYTTTLPGEPLINVRPRSIAEVHIGQGYALYNGGLPGKKQFLMDASNRRQKYLPPSIAWRYLYEQWHIHDPERVIPERKRSIHLDYTRLGMPPYNAELTVGITGKAYPKEAWRFVWGHLHVNNVEALGRARYATRVSMAVRDKILIQTKTWRPPRPGDRIKVGEAYVGQLVQQI